MRRTLLALALGLAGLLAALWVAAGRGATRGSRAEAPRPSADDSAPLNEIPAAPRAADEPARAPAARAARPLAAIVDAARPELAFPRLSLSGRVRRASGAPVAGADLHVYPDGGVTRVSAFGRATSGADGRFALPCIGSGPFRVVAYADVLSPAGVGTKGELAGVLAGGEDLDVVLADSASLRGTVHDAQGRALESFWLSLEPLDALARRACALPKETAFGSDGRFDFVLPCGEWRVGLDAEDERAGWSGVVRVPREEPLAIALGTRLVVRGRVVDLDGKPVSGAQVSADGRDFARSGADGGFELGVDAATSAWVQAHDEQRSSERVEAVAGSGDVVLALGEPQRSGHVLGRVVDEHGAPLAGIHVLATRGSAVTTHSDSNGAFELPLPRGEWELSAQRASPWHAEPESKRVEVVRGEVLRDVVLRGTAPTEIEARVLAPDGGETLGAQVLLTNVRGLLRGEIPCAPSGRARFVLGEEPLEVVARAAQGRRELRSRPVVVDRATSAPLELRLEPATRVTVRLLDAAGKKARGKVEALGHDGRAHVPTETDELVLVAPGPYLLRAFASPGRTGERAISLAGAPPQLEVEIRVE